MQRELRCFLATDQPSGLPGGRRCQSEQSVLGGRLIGSLEPEDLNRDHRTSQEAAVLGRAPVSALVSPLLPTESSGEGQAGGRGALWGQVVWAFQHSWGDPHQEGPSLDCRCPVWRFVSLELSQ